MGDASIRITEGGVRWIVSLRATDDGTPILVTDDPEVVRAVLGAIAQRVHSEDEHVGIPKLVAADEEHDE